MQCYCHVKIVFAPCRAAFKKVACRRIVFSFTQRVVDCCGFWMMSGFTSLVPDFFSLDQGGTELKLITGNNFQKKIGVFKTTNIVVLKTPIFALLLSVTHHTKNIMGQKVFFNTFYAI